MKESPVGVAQEKVLSALRLTAENFQDANRIFSAIGISVSSKRVGKSSEPVVRMMETTFGGWNAGGDGESYDAEYRNIDLTPIKQWIVN